MALVKKEQPYNGLQGVSQNTAQQLGNYQQGYTPGEAVTNAQNKLKTYEEGYKPSEEVTAAKGKLAGYQEGYTPSDTVVDAMSRLKALQNSKPQGYNSKYAPQLDAILAEIQNPEKFSWDFNGDELFKTYADMYTRKGQQGMMNAIGNAAALTGGYGNSYATQVGQQTFDEYMNDLYGIGMDLRDRAYQIYQDNRADTYNRLGALQSADQIDYGRYRDTVGDWKDELGYWTDYANNERNFDYGKYADELNYWTNQANYLDEQDYGRYADQRNYWTDRANTERNFDYNTFADALNYWTSMAGAENADYWTGEDFAEGQRQYDTTLAENVRQFDLSHGEKVRQFNENLAEEIRQYDASLAENIRQFNESLDWDKLSTEQKYAMANVATMLELGVAPSLETLLKAGFSEADARAIIGLFAPAAEPAGVGGMGGGTSPVDIASEFGKYAGWQFGEGAKSLADTMTEAASKVASGAADISGLTPALPTKDFSFPVNVGNAMGNAIAEGLKKRKESGK
jgi:hypothetical protein